MRVRFLGSHMSVAALISGVVLCSACGRGGDASSGSRDSAEGVAVRFFAAIARGDARLACSYALPSLSEEGPPAFGINARGRPASPPESPAAARAGAGCSSVAGHVIALGQVPSEPPVHALSVRTSANGRARVITSAGGVRMTLTESGWRVATLG
jgi:hypothetical protein